MEWLSDKVLLLVLVLLGTLGVHPNGAAQSLHAAHLL